MGSRLEPGVRNEMMRRLHKRRCDHNVIYPREADVRYKGINLIKQMFLHHYRDSFQATVRFMEEYDQKRMDRAVHGRTVRERVADAQEFRKTNIYAPPKALILDEAGKPVRLRRARFELSQDELKRISQDELKRISSPEFSD